MKSLVLGGLLLMGLPGGRGLDSLVPGMWTAYYPCEVLLTLAVGCAVDCISPLLGSATDMTTICTAVPQQRVCSVRLNAIQFLH